MTILGVRFSILLTFACIDSKAAIGRAMALASSSPSSSRPMSASGAGGGPPSTIPSGTTTCAVVGVGVLGTSLCRQLLEEGGVRVAGITKTRSRHDAIRAALDFPDFDLIASEDTPGADETSDSSSASPRTAAKYDSVVFCAPPSGFDDYASAVKDAVDQLWNRKGVFVFTSSGAVYGSGGEENEATVVVTESTPTASDENNPRISRMIRAEKAVLDAGGCCLRLAGLYNLNRGAHNFWLTKGSVAAAPNGLINLLHYDDAAGACVAALRAGLKSRVFLVSDGHPLTRREICAASLRAKLYEGYTMPEFADPAGHPETKMGKVYDAKVTNELLQWRPQYESFQAFMESQS